MASSFLPIFPFLPGLPSPLSALPAVINHLVASEPWARAQLLPHAGKTAELVMAPFQIRMAVTDGGDVALASADAPATVRIELSMSALPKILSEGPQAAMRQVSLTGDAEFAQVIGQVAQNLRWEPEEDLSRVVGDVAARRLVNGAKMGAAQFKRSNQRLAENVAEYLLEEKPELVRPRAVDDLSASIGTLRDDLARLEKRVERLGRL